MAFNWDYSTASLFSMAQEIINATARSEDLDFFRKYSSIWTEFQLMLIPAKSRKIIKAKESHLHIYQDKERSLRCFSAAELSGSSAPDLPDDSFNFQPRKIQVILSGNCISQPFSLNSRDKIIHFLPACAWRCHAETENQTNSYSYNTDLAKT